MSRLYRKNTNLATLVTVFWCCRRCIWTNFHSHDKCTVFWHHASQTKSMECKSIIEYIYRNLNTEVKFSNDEFIQKPVNTQFKNNRLTFTFTGIPYFSVRPVTTVIPLAQWQKSPTRLRSVCSWRQKLVQLVISQRY